MNETTYPISVAPWLAAYDHFEKRKSLDTWVKLYNRHCLNVPESEFVNLSINLFGCFWKRQHLPIAVRQLLNEQFQWKSRRRQLERHYSPHALASFIETLELGQHYLPDAGAVSFPAHYSAEEVHKYFTLFTHVYDQFREQLPCRIEKTYALQGYLDEVQDEQAYRLLLALYREQGRLEDWDTLAEQYCSMYKQSKEAMLCYIDLLLSRGQIDSAHQFAFDMQENLNELLNLASCKMLMKQHPMGQNSDQVLLDYQALATRYVDDLEIRLELALHGQETGMIESENEWDTNQWLLALGAIVQLLHDWEVYNWGHFDESSIGQRTHNRQLLIDAWGVENKTQLLNALENIYQNGRQYIYNHHRKPMECLSEYRLDTWQYHPKTDPETAHQISVIRDYYKTLGAGGVRGYDVSLAFYLCKLGMSLDLLEEEEARQIMLRFGRMVQPLFTDWKQYAISFMVGEHFLSPTSDLEMMNRVFEEIAMLLTDVHSPWRNIPWSMPLNQT